MGKRPAQLLEREMVFFRRPVRTSSHQSGLGVWFGTVFGYENGVMAMDGTHMYLSYISISLPSNDKGMVGGRNRGKSTQPVGVG